MYIVTRKITAKHLTSIGSPWHARLTGRKVSNRAKHGAFLAVSASAVALSLSLAATSPASAQTAPTLPTACTDSTGMTLASGDTLTCVSTTPIGPIETTEANISIVVGDAGNVTTVQGNMGNAAISASTAEDSTGGVTIHTANAVILARDAGNVGASTGRAIDADVLGSGDLTITTANVTGGGAGAGLAIHAHVGSDSVSDVTGNVTLDTSAGTVSGERGIDARNWGTGAVSVTTGDVDGSSNVTDSDIRIAVSAISGSGSQTDGTAELIVNTSAGEVTGESGIFGHHWGNGNVKITTGDVTTAGNVSDMEFAEAVRGQIGSETATDGTGLLYINTTAGSVSGERGVVAQHWGNGKVDIMTAAVTATDTAVWAQIGSADETRGTGDVVANTSAGAVTGGSMAISAANFGEGNVSVTTGDASANVNTGTAVSAWIGSESVTSGLGDVSVDTSGGDVAAHHGVVARNFGSGDVTVRTGDVTANVSAGTAVRAVIGSDSATRGEGDVYANTSAGDISARYGIVASNWGSGNVTVVAGDVAVGNAAIEVAGVGIMTAVDGAGETSITTTAGDVTAAGRGIVATSEGNISITTGDVTANPVPNVAAHTSQAIYARVGADDNTNVGGHVTIDTTSGDVTANVIAIQVANWGTGDIDIETANVTTTSGSLANAAIVATAGGSGDIAIDTTEGAVVGANVGIRAESTGTGDVDLTVGSVWATTANTGVAIHTVTQEGANVTVAMGANVFGAGGVAIHTDGEDGETPSDVVAVLGTVTGDIETNAGDDTVRVSGGSVTGNIAGGDGADMIHLSAGSVAGYIQGGDGDDTLRVTGGTAMSAINGGDGDDTVRLSGGTVGAIDGGADNDTLRIERGATFASFEGGAGDDTVQIETTFSRGGDDFANVEDVTIQNGAVVTLFDTFDADVEVGNDESSGSLTLGTDANAAVVGGLTVTDGWVAIAGAGDGVANVTGDLALTADSTVIVDIASVGTGANAVVSSDRFDVGGRATLAGTLHVRQHGIAEGDLHIVRGATSVSGDFADEDIVGLVEHALVSQSVTTDDSNVTLETEFTDVMQAVPEGNTIMRGANVVSAPLQAGDEVTFVSATAIGAIASNVSGSIAIGNMGNVTAVENDSGIAVTAVATDGGDVTVNAGYGNVMGTDDSGIAAGQLGSGNLSVTAFQVSSEGLTTNAAIDTIVNSGTTSISLAANAVVSSEESIAIRARSLGGDADVTVSGGANSRVTGATHGIHLTTNGADIALANVASVSGGAGWAVAARSNGGAISIRGLGNVTTVGSADMAAISATSVGGDVTIAGVGTASNVSGIFATDGEGIYVDASGGADGGDVTIGGAGGAAIGDITSEAEGIQASTDNAGDISIVTANVTSSGDLGVEAEITNRFESTSTGNISIDTSAGAVTADDFAVWTRNAGSGDVSVTTANVSSGSTAIFAHGNGDVSVTTGNVTLTGSAAESGVFAQVGSATATTGSGNITIDTSGGAVTGGSTSGISATNFGGGDVSITTAHVSNMNEGTAISATIGSATATMSTGDISVDTTAGDVSTDSDVAIDVSNFGSGATTLSVGNVSAGGADNAAIDVSTQAGASITVAANVTVQGGGDVAISTSGTTAMATPADNIVVRGNVAGAIQTYSGDDIVTLHDGSAFTSFDGGTHEDDDDRLALAFTEGTLDAELIGKLANVEAIHIASGETTTAGANVEFDSVAVSPAATLNIHAGNVVEFDSVDVAAMGTLNFASGAELNTGNVTNAGTLDLTSGSELTATGTVTNSGTLSIANTAVLSGDVDSSGTLNIAGGGEVSGDVTSSGTLNLANGADVVGDLSSTGALNIAGNMVGTADVDGNLTLGDGGTLTVQVLRNGSAVTHDSLDVSGNVTVDGSLVVRRNGVTQGTTTLIDGNVSASGSFDRVAGLVNGVVISQNIVVDAATGNVNLVSRVDGLPSSLTANQESTGAALLDDFVEGSLSGDIESVALGVFEVDDAAGLGRVLDGMTPHIANSGLDVMRAHQDKFQQRLLDGGSAGAAGSGAGEQSGERSLASGARIWAQFGYDYHSNQNDGNAIGYRSNGYSYGFGISDLNAGAVRFGVAASYSVYDVSSRRGGAHESDNRMWQIGASAGVPFGSGGSGLQGRADIALAYSDARHDLVMDLPAVASTGGDRRQTGRADLTSFGADLRVMLDGNSGSKWPISPFVGFSYDSTRQNATSLTGNGGAAIEVDRATYGRFTVSYGARFHSEVGENASVWLGAGGYHHFGDTQGMLRSRFTAQGSGAPQFVTLGHDVRTEVRVEGGASMGFGGNWSLSLQGHAEFVDITGYGARLTLSKGF